jgi:tRNA pseudouridine55 synthase
VVVDKPSGLTSHQVVARARRLLGTRKVGHAGTLDPMATGVLVLGAGRATRLLGYLSVTDKAYRATIRLGQTTLTDDAEGEPVVAGGAAGVLDAAIDPAGPVVGLGDQGRRCPRVLPGASGG